jgi:hypothetical protein
MKRKETYQEKLFNDFRLSELVSEGNPYRRSRVSLHLDFLYKETKSFYGFSGQKSIYPSFSSSFVWGVI